MSTPASPVTRLFDAFTAYQRTAALKTAIELDLFTAVGAGADTLPALAQRCGAAERGIRALANRLVVDGFLTRDGDRYGLAPETGMFLDRTSPVYTGSVINFLIIAAVIFLIIVKVLGSVVKRVAPPEPSEPTQKECPLCLSTIPAKARKCSHCTADLPVTA